MAVSEAALDSLCHLARRLIPAWLAVKACLLVCSIPASSVEAAGAAARTELPRAQDGAAVPASQCARGPACAGREVPRLTRQCAQATGSPRCLRAPSQGAAQGRARPWRGPAVRIPQAPGAAAAGASPAVLSPGSPDTQPSAAQRAWRVEVQLQDRSVVGGSFASELDAQAAALELHSELAGQAPAPGHMGVEESAPGPAAARCARLPHSYKRTGSACLRCCVRQWHQ